MHSLLQVYVVDPVEVSQWKIPDKQHLPTHHAAEESLSLTFLNVVIITVVVIYIWQHISAEYIRRYQLIPIFPAEVQRTLK